MIENTGTTKTTINDKMVNEIDWKASYNGSIADIDVNMNKNGQKNHISMRLNNEDLNHILSSHNDSQLLHQRLMEDFPLSEYSKMKFKGSDLNKKLKFKSKKTQNNTKKKQKLTRKKRKNMRKK
jgi:hypothetical protein